MKQSDRFIELLYGLARGREVGVSNLPQVDRRRLLSRALSSIDIGGGAGNTQYDAESGHVLAAVHGSPVLVEIDPLVPKVVGRMALHKVSTCHGLLIASKLRLAFAACRGAIEQVRSEA